MIQNSLIQGTPEWLEMRKYKIGASDAPIIMNESPFGTPYSLWEEKLDIRQKHQSFAMRYGHEMEPVARHSFEKEIMCTVEPAVIFHPEKKWMMASLDGLNIETKTAVEIKNPGEEDHEIAKSGKVPKKYFAQLQHQLEILFALYSIDELCYFSHRHGDTALVKIGIDNAYVSSMMKKEEEFYNNIINFTPPSFTHKDYININSRESQKKAGELLELMPKLKKLQDREKQLKQDLIDLSEGRNSIMSGIKLTKVVRKGLVDYGAIPELKSVDLDQYRKHANTSWRISVC